MAPVQIDRHPLAEPDVAQALGVGAVGAFSVQEPAST